LQECFSHYSAECLNWSSEANVQSLAVLATRSGSKPVVSAKTRSRRALESGVSEEKRARALNVNAEHIKRRFNLLKCICREAVHC
jgi:hypothetical protein